MALGGVDHAILTLADVGHKTVTLVAGVGREAVFLAWVGHKTVTLAGGDHSLDTSSTWCGADHKTVLRPLDVCRKDLVMTAP